ncbi:hypothetical protein IP83_08535 [Novosphingobium sp. AAP93]|nr:hypothetical protein IP83_08535 [Novosphingobium sp. AAP93]
MLSDAAYRACQSHLPVLQGTLHAPNYVKAARGRRCRACLRLDRRAGICRECGPMGMPYRLWRE